MTPETRGRLQTILDELAPHFVGHALTPAALAALDAREARVSEIEFREWRKRGEPCGSFEEWRAQRHREATAALFAA